MKFSPASDVPAPRVILVALHSTGVELLEPNHRKTFPHSALINKDPGWGRERSEEEKKRKKDVAPGHR